MAPSTVQSRGHRPRDWRMAVEVVAFTAPALILFAMFVVWPMVRAVQFSLYRWKGFGPLVDFVGLKNYVSVLTNDVFIGALGHNLFIVVASIAIQLPLGIAIALLLNQKIRGRGLLRTVVFVPYVLAEVIAGVVWFQLLQPKYGVIDSLLSAVGIHGPAQGFLGTPEYALPVSPEPGYSAIAEHVEKALVELIDELPVPERHRPQADSLRERILAGLNLYELVPVLDE